MIEPGHMDFRYFVIIECSSHLGNGCTIKCGCIGVIPIKINQLFAKFARPPSDFDEIWQTCR